MPNPVKRQSHPNVEGLTKANHGKPNETPSNPSSSLSPPIHDITDGTIQSHRKAIELVFHSFYSCSTIASQSCSKIRGSFAQRHARYSYRIHDQAIPGEAILRVSIQRQLPKLRPPGASRKRPTASWRALWQRAAQRLRNT